MIKKKKSDLKCILNGQLSIQKSQFSLQNGNR